MSSSNGVGLRGRGKVKTPKPDRDVLPEESIGPAPSLDELASRLDVSLDSDDGHGGTRDSNLWRRRRVAVLRIAKATPETIASTLGVSVGVVEKDLTFIRATWRKDLDDRSEGLRSEMLATLDALELSLQQKLAQYIDSKHIGTAMMIIDRIIAIQDRRIRMFALDSPMSGSTDGSLIIQQYEDEASYVTGSQSNSPGGSNQRPEQGRVEALQSDSETA